MQPERVLFYSKYGYCSLEPTPLSQKPVVKPDSTLPPDPRPVEQISGDPGPTENNSMHASESEDEMVCVRFTWGGSGYLLRSFLKSHLTLHVKPFIGSRKTLVLTMPVETTVAGVLSEVLRQLKEENPGFPVDCLRPTLVYPMVGSFQ